MNGVDPEAVKARESAATPGPWLARDRGAGWEIVYGPAARPLPVGDRTDLGREEDAQFIAHARTDVPRLLARVAELEGALEDSRRWAIRMLCDDGAFQEWMERREHGRRFVSPYDRETIVRYLESSGGWRAGSTDPVVLERDTARRLLAGLTVEAAGWLAQRDHERERADLAESRLRALDRADRDGVAVDGEQGGVQR